MKKSILATGLVLVSTFALAETDTEEFISYIFVKGEKVELRRVIIDTKIEDGNIVQYIETKQRQGFNKDDRDFTVTTDVLVNPIPERHELEKYKGKDTFPNLKKYMN